MKKEIIKKKQYLDITLEDKLGRKQSITYGGGYDDEYVFKYITEKVSKIKRGQKLSIEAYEILKNN